MKLKIKAYIKYIKHSILLGFWWVIYILPSARISSLNKQIEKCDEEINSLDVSLINFLTCSAQVLSNEEKRLIIKKLNRAIQKRDKLKGKYKKLLPTFNYITDEITHYSESRKVFKKIAESVDSILGCDMTPETLMNTIESNDNTALSFGFNEENGNDI